MIQGFILSSFLWGDMVMQCPAGMLVCKYGASRFISFTLIVNSVVTILSPYFAYWVSDWVEQMYCTFYILNIERVFITFTKIGKTLPL